MDRLSESVKGYLEELCQGMNMYSLSEIEDAYKRVEQLDAGADNYRDMGRDELEPLLKEAENAVKDIERMKGSLETERGKYVSEHGQKKTDEIKASLDYALNRAKQIRGYIDLTYHQKLPKPDWKDVAENPDKYM